MRHDLERYVGLVFKKEKRELPCIILQRTGDGDLLQTKGGQAQNTFKASSSWKVYTESVRVLTNQPFKRLSHFIKSRINYQQKLSFVDESNYTGNIDISVRMESVDPFNMEELNKDLKKYGLQLIKGKREVDVFVFYELNRK